MEQSNGEILSGSSEWTGYSHIAFSMFQDYYKQDLEKYGVPNTIENPIVMAKAVDLWLNTLDTTCGKVVSTGGDAKQWEHQCETEMEAKHMSWQLHDQINSLVDPGPPALGPQCLLIHILAWKSSGGCAEHFFGLSDNDWVFLWLAGWCSLCPNLAGMWKMFVSQEYCKECIGIQSVIISTSIGYFSCAQDLEAVKESNMTSHIDAWANLVASLDTSSGK
ncbi:hypothetical protein EV421DRAFT_1729457 [Armillaria borealis]|uniref:Uncharacterized protein n=1 Tax=Armillaria borealis TaxID=47425 RepID=A0AA39N4A6_9AGAR|nr:hypothetical protein EV421DRAFT_1729457 [Armillaria borealis]